MTPPDDDLIPRLSWRDVAWLAALALTSAAVICAVAVVAGRAMMGG